MFSGIVEEVASICAVWDGRKSRKLTLESHWTDCALGQSIAVNGCCLTIAEILPGGLVFDVVRETLEKTNLGRLERGSAVNVERALRLGDRLDGHFVQGHIDGTALLLERREDGEDYRLRLQSPEGSAKYLAPKGSVCLDGVSLTIAAVDGEQFEVALIPATLARTTLGKKPPNWPLNMEADILSKTVVSWLEQTRGAGTAAE